MKIAFTLSLIVAASVPMVAAAQSRGPSAPSVLVRAGNVFDAEQGRMVGPRDILIRNGRVAEIGEALTAPDGASALDLSRCSVTPGLIDGHTHLLLEQGANEGLSAVAARDHGLNGDVYRAMQGAQRGREYLAAGFTTVRDLGNSGRFLDLQLAHGVDDGVAPGPRIYGSGPGLAPAGGQMEPLSTDPHDLVNGEYRIVNGVDDTRAAVREAIARGARVIKIYPEATPQRTRMSVEEIQAAVSEARRHGVPVAAHATSDASIREAVEAGVTSVEHAYEVSDETLRLMAARGVWLVPTDPSLQMAVNFTATWPDPPSREDVEAHLAPGRDRLARARRLGVPIAMGSDMYVPYPDGRGRASLETMQGYVEAGMTPAEALQSATWNAARMLGDERLGVLRAGAYADLVVVEGDPTLSLAPLTAPRMVMKAGRIEAGAASSCGS